MTQQIKIIAYVVLLGFAVWFGWGFFKNLSAATPDPDAGGAENAREIPPPPPTNQDPATTEVETNLATNAAATNAVASTNTAVTPPKKAQAATPRQSRGQNTSAVLSYGAGLVVTIICLGLIVAHDFSRFAAHRFEKFIFDEDLEGAKDPEYEEAEKVWANGKFLEAIQLMRDHLKSHPREQYVALRIAEIYEKDLGNFLAAALEYEEILKKKLPAERWGWAAIHLANLYSGKLNKSQQAVDLLQRIIAEYSQTAAAKKARERLVAQGIDIPEPLAPATEEASASSPPPSNLPPGFTPKKG